MNESILKPGEMFKLRINLSFNQFFFRTLNVEYPPYHATTCLLCLLSFQERHSWDVPSTPGSSQQLLRLLQEAAVLRYINADVFLFAGIT